MTGNPLVASVTLVAATGVLVDLFALLLLPSRIGGHLVPLGPALAFAGNAGLGWVGMRVLRSRAPAQVLVVLAILLSLVAATRGPGGDLFVTRELQGMYLLYVVAAALGASVPLVVRKPT